jgi:hypothetical protein
MEVVLESQRSLEMSVVRRAKALLAKALLCAWYKIHSGGASSSELIALQQLEK